MKSLRPLVLVAVVAWSVGPLYLAAVVALGPESQLYAAPTLWPRALTLVHVRALFLARDFVRPLLNSLVVASATTALCVPLAAGCAWALSRLRVRGRGALTGLVLVVSMFPPVSILSPLYLMLRWLGLIDTYAGLVLPYTTFALPLAIWLLVGFFDRLPRELEEAALVDGAGRLRTFAEILLPLAAPGLAATAILTFVASWNEFLFALAFTTGPHRRTLPVAVALYRGQYEVPWGEVLAAALLATLPVALLVLVMQRRIVEGLTAGAVKES